MERKRRKRKRSYGAAARAPRALADLRQRETRSTMAMLRAVGAPVVWLTFIYLAATTPSLDHERNLDHVEYFAGEMAVTKVLVQAGKLRIRYEILDAPGMGILTPLGLVLAISYFSRVKRGGGTFGVLACSTWTFMNRWRASGPKLSQRAT